MLPELLDQIPGDQKIGSVTPMAGMTHASATMPSPDTEAMPSSRHAGTPTLETDTVGVRTRNDILRATKHLGRALWRRWSDYHHPGGRTETRMNCLKPLGKRLMARDFDRQVAEIHVCIAVLNRYTALGIPITNAAA